ncbi:MAG: formyltransferase family protein, partial [Rhodospirillales bacterium]|nr:formyltransferase family protein [Rhodospirillales bacterium]
PRLGCVNIHGSLLPRWRGAAPIQRAIEAGDAQTGITIMQMDEGLDTGAMLMREAMPIMDTMTAQDLHDALAGLGARMIVAALAGLSDGTLHPEPQPEDGVTYARKITKDEGRLDWMRSAGELSRMVRALTPWPGAWFEHGKERIKVLAAEAVEGAGAPGTVIEGVLTVACGKDALRLLRVQRAGKGPTDADAFLRGYALPPGTVLDGEKA